MASSPGEPRAFVLVGTSGTGKTALLEALISRGYPGFVEPVRAVLEEKLAHDGPALPAKDPRLFLDRLLSVFLSDRERALGHGGPCFFDRGLPDLIAYAGRFGVDPTSYIDAAKRYRYASTVFVLPPWKEIFHQDEMRGGTYEQYEAFHARILSAYDHVGYQALLVPKVSLVERVAFIEGQLHVSGESP